MHRILLAAAATLVVAAGVGGSGASALAAEPATADRPIVTGEPRRGAEQAEAPECEWIDIEIVVNTETGEEGCYDYNNNVCEP